jgi:hypothetical protein
VKRLGIALLLVIAVSAPARAADADSLRVAPDFHAPAPSPGLRYFPGDFLRDRAGGPAAGYMAVMLQPRSSLWYEPPTRLDAMLQGAGAATSMAMFFGAVGTTLGWFDEDTSWAITGAMAAAGALYAGTRYEPQPKLNFRWAGDSVIPGYATPR